MNLGNLSPNYFEMPLVGKVAAMFTLRNDDDTAFTLDAAYEYSFSVSKNPGGAALFTRIVGDGLHLQDTLTDGKVLIALTGPQTGMLSPQQLYSYVFTVTNADGHVILSNSGYMIPMLVPGNVEYPAENADFNSTDFASEDFATT